MPQLLERVNFGKIVTVLALSFAVGLGLCGLNYIAVSALTRPNTGLPPAILIGTGWVELLVMVLSAVGLVVTFAIWGVAAVINGGIHGRSGPQRLFDRDDETGHNP